MLEEVCAIPAHVLSGSPFQHGQLDKLEFVAQEILLLE